MSKFIHGVFCKSKSSHVINDFEIKNLFVLHVIRMLIHHIRIKNSNLNNNLDKRKEK